MAIVSLCSCEDKSTDGTGNSVNLERDLVLHYTFNEGPSTSTVQTVADHSDKRINGVVSGNADFVSDTPEGSGYALKLRKDDFLNIPIYPMTDSVNVSVSMWVKDFSQGWLLYASDGNDRATPSVKINENDQVFYVAGRYNDNTFSPSMTAFQAGGWHHIVVASSDNQGKCMLYVDGVLLDTQNCNQSQVGGTKMQIGINADPMTVDNVRVYKRCLNEKEVKELYNKKQ